MIDRGGLAIQAFGQCSAELGLMRKNGETSLDIKNAEINGVFENRVALIDRTA